MTSPKPPVPRSSRLPDLLIGAGSLVLCATCATYLSIRHVLWPRLDHWRPELVSSVSRLIDRPVSVGRLQPGWQGLSPTLRLESIRLGDREGAIRLEIEAVDLRLSWRSLLVGAPRLKSMHLQAPRLDIERLPNGRIELAGFLLPDDNKINEPALNWAMSQDILQARDGVIRLIDRSGAWPTRQLAGVSIDIRNAGRHHEAQVLVEHALQTDAQLQAQLSFDRPAGSFRPRWRLWDGELHLMTRGFELEPLAGIVIEMTPSLRERKASAKAQVDHRSWLRFKDAHILDARLKWLARQPGAAASGRRLAMASFRGDLDISARDGAGHAMRLREAEVVDPRGFVLKGSADGEFNADSTPHSGRVQASLGSIDVAALIAASRRLPLSADLLAHLNRVDLTGRLDGVHLHAAIPSSRAGRPAFGMNAEFARLGARWTGAGAAAQHPAFANLSGVVRFDERSGRVNLSSRSAVVSLPKVFDEPDIRFDRLDGEFGWTIDSRLGSDTLRVSAPRLEFANADASGRITADWQGDGHGPGQIRLTGRIDRGQLARVARYMPKVIPRTRAWVEEALLDGEVQDVSIEVQGDLKHFPFRDPAHGNLSIAGRVRDGTIAYSPLWPRITQARGDLLFSRGGFEVTAQSGETAGVTLSDVRVQVPDYRTEVVRIQGLGTGAAQAMLRFIDDSPLSASVSSFTQDLQITGPARLGLNLTLPLLELNTMQVRGSVDFANNALVLDKTLPPFSDLTGRLEFSEQGLVLTSLAAGLLGGPIAIEGRPSGEGRMQIDATGAVSAQGMRQVIDNPLTRRLEGQMAYRARVDVDHRASSLTLESDLLGLSSSLPAPFTKSADEAWPLRVVSQPLAVASTRDRPPGDRLKVSLNNRIALALERERDPNTERLRVRRAGFAVDDAPVLRDAGLSVLLRLPAFDFDAWRSLLSDGDLERMQQEAASAAIPGMVLVPDFVSVVADDLRIGGRDLHEVVLGASRSEGRWRANIASREITGHFDWVDARPGQQIGTLTARFDRLVLPRSREGEIESALSAPPERLPALDITADELVLGDVPVGALRLSASNGGSDEQPVWTLERLQIDNPQARLDAAGAWSFRRPRIAGNTGVANKAPEGEAAAVRSTDLDFSLMVRNGGGLLERIGVKQALRGGQGSIDGSIQWKGSPLAIDYPSLDGALRLDLSQGAFLRIDPGPARLIAVLNMQAVPRLLSGQLREVFGEGFAFDGITGEVRIESGVAHTDDLTMRGAQAQVVLRGEADLAAETQSLRVQVVPEVDAGLASIAVGAMINPLLGVGSLLAQYVLRKPLQDALGMEIDITGSWADPTVRDRAKSPSNRP